MDVILPTPEPPVWIGLTTARTYYRIKFDYHPALVEKMGNFFPRHWRKKEKEWMVAASAEVLTKLRQQFPNATYDAAVIDQELALEKQDKAVSGIKIAAQMGELLKLPPEVSFHTEPFAHQKTALALAIARPNFGLFMDMGTGKTKVILDLIAYLKKTVGPDPKDSCSVWEPTLIFAPVAVLDNWRREAGVHQPSLRVFPLLKGSSADKAAEIKHLREHDLADIIVVNYETAWRIESAIQQYYWSSLVLDESQRIKNRASKQAKATVKIGKWARRRYLLTGTPHPNSPLEVFNQIKFLDPLVLGTSYYAFRDRYAVMGGYQGYQTIGWKNLDELSERLSKISYCVKKQDCLDLPEKVYKEYRMPMAQTQEKAYKQMADSLVAEVDGTTVTVEVILAKLTKLRQITSGFIYTDEQSLHFNPNPKLEKLMEILGTLCPDHKVVIWTLFEEEQLMIKKALEELNMERAKNHYPPINSVSLDGSVPNDKRAGIVESFQKDPGVHVFVGQQRAGGIGITLTAADYCIFFSNDYSPEIRYQAEDRLHRIGQKANVVYIDLLMKGTIDTAIKAALARKKKVSDLVENNGVKEMIYGGQDDASFQ